MKESFREKLKRITPLKIAVVSFRVLKNKYNLFQKIKSLFLFFNDYKKYKKLSANKHFSLQTKDLYPRIYDKTFVTPLDPVYFYQNAWCAKKIFENKPEKHFDIGSDAKFVGLISQFVPTTMVDIRPLGVTLPQLSFVKGDMLRLPFNDNEIHSLSSLCVIEHIGLGRYGDTLDPYGSEKACSELIRVLAHGGSLYISIPVDSNNKVYFNAHRAFTREYILSLFSTLALAEERYLYGNALFEAYDSKKLFGTGFFHFVKNK
jgi:SAM-dependent methyltransferase